MTGDCGQCSLSNNEDTRESVNHGVEVNLAEPGEPKGDVTVHKMKKHEEDLAQKCEKMEKFCRT